MAYDQLQKGERAPQEKESDMFSIGQIIKITQIDGTSTWHTITTQPGPSGFRTSPLKWAKTLKESRDAGKGWAVLTVADLRAGDIVSRDEDALEAIAGRAIHHWREGQELMTPDDIDWHGIALDSEYVLKAHIYPSGLDYCDITYLREDYDQSEGHHDGGDEILVFRPQP